MRSPSASLVGEVAGDPTVGVDGGGGSASGVEVARSMVKASSSSSRRPARRGSQQPDAQRLDVQVTIRSRTRRTVGRPVRDRCSRSRKASFDLADEVEVDGDVRIDTSRSSSTSYVAPSARMRPRRRSRTVARATLDCSSDTSASDHGHEVRRASSPPARCWRKYVAMSNSREHHHFALTCSDPSSASRAMARSQSHGASRAWRRRSTRCVEVAQRILTVTDAGQRLARHTVKPAPGCSVTTTNRTSSDRRRRLLVARIDVTDSETSGTRRWRW